MAVQPGLCWTWSKPPEDRCSHNKAHICYASHFLQRVNAAVKEEYLKRVFNAILVNVELENLEPGIGECLMPYSLILN